MFAICCCMHFSTALCLSSIPEDRIQRVCWK
jgi:hypothetical protein